MVTQWHCDTVQPASKHLSEPVLGCLALLIQYTSQNDFMQRQIITVTVCTDKVALGPMLKLSCNIATCYELLWTIIHCAALCYTGQEVSPMLKPPTSLLPVASADLPPLIIAWGQWRWWQWWKWWWWWQWWSKRVQHLYCKWASSAPSSQFQPTFSNTVHWRKATILKQTNSGEKSTFSNWTLFIVLLQHCQSDCTDVLCC